MYKWNHYIRVVLNEVVVEIAEAQKQLNIFDPEGF